MQPIYLDYNATTPVNETVLKAMLPYFTTQYANAASLTHAAGISISKEIETCRATVAAILNAEPQEIYFTSGATECLNMALIGIYNQYKEKGNHIITCKTEHKAVLATCKYLSTQGAHITYLDVDFEGLIDLQQLQKALLPTTIAVCIMLANNETGVLQPITQIAAIAHAHNAILISDTTQAIGKMHVDVNELGIDVACITAHKLYGPKGVGALYLRRKNPRVSITPFTYGGAHERGLRSGTLNTTGIIGMAKACELATQNLWEYAIHTSKLRTMLEQQLQAQNLVTINGSTRYRLPNTSNLTFKNITANKFITKFPQLCVATGSACTSAVNEPSHVLTAMGLSTTLAQQSIRFSVGMPTTMENIITAVNSIKLKLTLTE
ncbi:MAG: cysteine desulfurase [Bacteroidia bacterium]|nr:cysteine desulfurase [Bacteroidia bacterium]